MADDPLARALEENRRRSEVMAASQPNYQPAPALPRFCSWPSGGGYVVKDRDTGGIVGGWTSERWIADSRAAWWNEHPPGGLAVEG